MAQTVDIVQDFCDCTIKFERNLTPDFNLSVERPRERRIINHRDVVLLTEAPDT